MLRRGQRQWRAHNLSRFLSFWDATISTTLRYFIFWQCLTWTKLLFRNFWQLVPEFPNFFSFERKPGRTPSPFRYTFKMRITIRKWRVQQYLGHVFEQRRVWDFGNAERSRKLNRGFEAPVLCVSWRSSIVSQLWSTNEFYANSRHMRYRFDLCRSSRPRYERFLGCKVWLLNRKQHDCSEAGNRNAVPAQASWVLHVN